MEEERKEQCKEESQCTHLKEESQYTHLKEESQCTHLKEHFQCIHLKEESQYTHLKEESQCTHLKEHFQCTHLKESQALQNINKVINDISSTFQSDSQSSSNCESIYYYFLEREEAAQLSEQFLPWILEKFFPEVANSISKEEINSHKNEETNSRISFQSTKSSSNLQTSSRSISFIEQPNKHNTAGNDHIVKCIIKSWTKNYSFSIINEETNLNCNSLISNSRIIDYGDGSQSLRVKFYPIKQIIQILQGKPFLISSFMECNRFIQRGFRFCIQFGHKTIYSESFYIHSRKPSISK